MSQHDVILLLGSNIGDRKKNIKTAIEKIEQLAGRILNKSEILETKPIEFASFNIFINFAVLLKTYHSPYNLLKIIKKIEREMGREKDSRAIGRYEDRIIDIDIVTYSNLTFVCKSLEIPHKKHLYEREFSKKLITQLYLEKHKL
ncbi:MAG: 2-amino-4-hydroxy-6-hydroxymethyldihydropteridine diphosphokinase [Cruoricaptor ignavus]|nr:2-amino-4-hydroxy-6-hydroxymethyldihydropteridine diphosphokinase [Cruoricaptor ignavus]